MMRARLATPEDSPAIARIYNEGIEDRVATFETRLRTAADVSAWFDGIHPIVVVEEDGDVVAFASTSQYRPRPCYAGVAEFSVYVARRARGRGAGRRAMEALLDACEGAGSGSWSLASSRRTSRAVACSGPWASWRRGSTRSTPASTACGATSSSSSG